MADNDILFELEKILIARKSADADSSYVASLYKKGDNAILKKITEEATELVMAVKDSDKKHTIYETADLLFHILVLLAKKNIKVDEVLDELSKRFGTSGLLEKSSRNK